MLLFQFSAADLAILGPNFLLNDDELDVDEEMQEPTPLASPVPMTDTESIRPSPYVQTPTCIINSIAASASRCYTCSMSAFVSFGNIPSTSAESRPSPQLSATLPSYIRSAGFIRPYVKSPLARGSMQWTERRTPCGSTVSRRRVNDGRSACARVYVDLVRSHSYV